MKTPADEQTASIRPTYEQLLELACDLWDLIREFDGVKDEYGDIALWDEVLPRVTYERLASLPPYPDWISDNTEPEAHPLATERSPTLGDVERLCEEHGFEVEGYKSTECLREIIHEALARWGHPAPTLASNDHKHF